MRLLLDTDVFCKLGVAGLLLDAVGLFDTTLAECARLPALPRMLARGRLRDTFGPVESDRLILLANEVPAIPRPSATWLDRLADIDSIDPGEALLFAAAAELGSLVVSGDKRALAALRNVEGFVAALDRRVVVLEAVLLALCERYGTEAIRTRVAPLLPHDRTVRVCFSRENASPTGALESYRQDLAARLHPLVLWSRPGDAP